jgi:hypothetical protein
MGAQNTFIVDLKQALRARTGDRAIAQKGIDITAFSASTCGDSGTLALVTSDDAGTQRALTEASGSSHLPGVEASFANRPARSPGGPQLGKAGVNIEAASRRAWSAATSILPLRPTTRRRP